MNLVAQETGPQKGTDSQPASSRVILKGSVLNARARRVRSDSALAVHEQTDIKKPRGCEADIRLVLRLILRGGCPGTLQLHHRLPAAIVFIHDRVVLFAREAVLIGVLGVNHHCELCHR